MNRQLAIFTVIGLAVGILIGALLVGTNESLRVSLFGGATPPEKPEDDAYYQIEFAQASAWLEEEHPEVREELGGALEAVGALTTVPETPEELLTVQESVMTTLTGMYIALTGVDVAGGETAADLPDEPTTTICLGMDINPRLGKPVLYLYATIPVSEADALPEGWQELDRSRENDIFWLLLGCQPPETEITS